MSVCVCVCERERERERERGRARESAHKLETQSTRKHVHSYRAQSHDVSNTEKHLNQSLFLAANLK